MNIQPRVVLALGLLGLVSAVLLLLGLAAGASGWQFAGLDADASLVWQIRWPRSLGAWLAGALFGLAGAIAQGLFRNPLADPFLLGSASGAALALSLALLGFAGANSLSASLGLSGAAFVGALLGVALALVLARGARHSVRLLLAGVVVGVVLGAARELVVLARPDVLLATQSFMLGSTTTLDLRGCALMAVVLLLSLPLALLLSPLLEALGLGEATARSLGLPVTAAQALLVVLLALATGAAVAQTGLIAFVGLAAPHCVRLLGVMRQAAQLVGSALAGGVLLLGADLVARTVLAPQELPVGVITALAGGAYLLLLLQRQRV